LNPGSIDNSALLKPDSDDLRDHMIDELDFVLVPDEAWNLLVQEFGITSGQEPIARKV
jgi:ubiquitin carboxyl-terminal hydrolase 4/11/15